MKNFQRKNNLSGDLITDNKEITHLFVIKWLKGSIGVIKKYRYE